MSEPELIADYACITGEGPLWHPGEGRVYWLDIDRGRIFRYHPATGHHEICYEGEVVGGSSSVLSRLIWTDSRPLAIERLCWRT